MILTPNLYNKFSILNNIEKLSEPIFDFDDSAMYLKEKKEIGHNPYHREHTDEEQVETVSWFILEEARLISANFEGLAYQIPEDIAIISVSPSDRKDVMSLCHICFPSNWKPEEKIGCSFAKIHQDIPGYTYNPNLIKSLLEGRYQRFVWSLIFKNQLNQYPGTSPKFHIQRPEVFLKIEKQITIGFPGESCFLFIMRQYIYPMDKVDIDILNHTISEMSPEHLKYKGITIELKDYLCKI